MAEQPPEQSSEPRRQSDPVERRKSERIERPSERPSQRSARPPEKPLQQAVVWRNPWRTQTQTLAIGVLVVVVALIIGALFLAQATTTVTTGQHLVDLQVTRDYLQRANEETSAQIAQKRNISVLRGRAQALGFLPVGPENIEYIVVNGFSTIRATATPEFTPEPVFVYNETFNGWTQEQWNNLVKQFETWMGGTNATPTP